ncbi:hypothetical protein FOXYSP1_00497 [Fusarium oxysporum f. sp. phaseoli]
MVAIPVPTMMPCSICSTTSRSPRHLSIP